MRMRTHLLAIRRLRSNLFQKVNSQRMRWYFVVKCCKTISLAAANRTLNFFKFLTAVYTLFVSIRNVWMVLQATLFRAILASKIIFGPALVSAIKFRSFFCAWNRTFAARITTACFCLAFQALARTDKVNLAGSHIRHALVARANQISSSSCPYATSACSFGIMQRFAAIDLEIWEK